MSPTGPIIDGNVQLWDQRHNPVFRLTDRTLVRDLLGDYDSLPGAADPVAAAEWVSSQHEERALVTGLVSLGDPAAGDFGDLVDRLCRIPLVRSIRVRPASGLVLSDAGRHTHLGRLAEHTPRDRQMLFHDTAKQWYGTR